METIKSEFVRTDENGKDWWRCVIVATSEPESMEISGADVDGVADDDGIAAGSVLLYPDNNKLIAYEDGVFGGGGGGSTTATVLIENDTGANTNILYAVDETAWENVDTTAISITTGPNTLTLDIGSVICPSNYDEFSTVEGDITAVAYGGYRVDGQCSVVISGGK